MRTAGALATLGMFSVASMPSWRVRIHSPARATVAFAKKRVRAAERRIAQAWRIADLPGEFAFREDLDLLACPKNTASCPFREIRP
jgi:hypothetical protein